MRPRRSLALVVPDWSAVSAGYEPEVPVAVLAANRVVAASPAARARGVVLGLRRREAQGRCPEVVVVERDPARDARNFEPVVAAVTEVVTPWVEVTEPGRGLFPTRGPSRYHGGDEGLVARVRAVTQPVVGRRATVRVGVADGPFAAVRAALDEVVVAPGDTARYLAPLPVGTLPLDERTLLVLRRLGMRTLGDLAALPAGDVVARFGPAGARAHRLAAGLDPDVPVTAPLRDEVVAATTFEPPVDRVDTVAFATRPLADELVGRLGAAGQACTGLLVTAETEHGERRERRWRHDAFTEGAVVERVRWQLEGWFQGGAGQRPTAGLVRLELRATEVVAATGTQPALFGGRRAVDGEVVRALARLSGLLGPEAVGVPRPGSGRHPDTQLVLVPAEIADLHEPAPPPPDPAPWPGRVPPPSPTTVLTGGDRPVVEVLDRQGTVVGVDGRGEVSAPPAALRVRAGDRPRAVTAWAGPWPADEHWWDPAAHRRRARFQLVTDDGVARLVSRERGHWYLDATYD